MKQKRAAIAASIRRFRNEHGLSVEEVGAHVGKSGKTVSAWEVGRGQPDADVLIELCRLFGVDIADFYNEQKPLTDEEERILHIFRSMNKIGRETMLRMTETLFEQFEVKNDKSSGGELQKKLSA